MAETDLEEEDLGEDEGFKKIMTQPIKEGINQGTEGEKTPKPMDVKPGNLLVV